MVQNDEMKNERVLAATVTGEPLQPVRLYWSVPKRSTVTPVFSALRCVVPEPGGAWVWLYEDEARVISLMTPYDKLPPVVHPLHIGRFRLQARPGQGTRAKKDQRLVMELRSFDRAVEAAKFFAPRFGRGVLLERVRLINRLFEGHEMVGGLHVLDRLLDQNVVVVDPRETEEALERALVSARTLHEKRLAFERFSHELRKKDVPLVEDFPLCPEEETPEFRDLAITLRLRLARAMDHFHGKPITLAELIHRAYAEPAADGTMRR